MRAPLLLTRRSAARVDQLLAALAVVAVGSGAVAALLAALAAGLDAGAAAVVRDAEPTAGALRVDTALEPDPASQDESYRAGIATAIGAAPLEVLRSIRSAPIEATVDGRVRPVVLGSQEGIERLAELVAGDWAVAPDEATLPEGAASALGVGPGDAIAAEGHSWRVVGVWRVRDAGSPAWYGETVVASGLAGDAAGPVLVDDAALAELSPRPSVRWTLVPRAGDLGVAALDLLDPVENRLRAEASRLGSGSRYAVTSSGELSATVARAQGAVATSRALGGVAVVLVAAAAGLVLALIARLLAQSRADETLLLRSRGLSRARLAAWSAAEALLTALLGTVLGLGAVLGAAGLGWGTAPGADALLAGGALGILGGSLVLVPAAGSGDATTRARRGRPVAEAESVAPALFAAALAVVAVVATATGSTAAAPVAAVAPALVLLAAVLLIRLLLAPALRAVELAAARRPGLIPVLPLRQLGRRPRAIAAAFVVVALAAGGIVFAGIARAALDRSDASAVAAAVGADVRIRFDDVARDPVRAEAYRALPGVEAAVPVAVADVGFGPLRARLLVAPAGIAEVVPAAVPPASAGDLAIAVTPALARQLGVGPGDRLAMTVGSSSPLAATVSSVAPIPAVGALGALVDADALADALPPDAGVPTGELWLSTGDPDAVADEVRAASARAATVTVRSSVTTASIGAVGSRAAASAALVVTLIAWGGFAAAAAALARQRRGEVLPLRSLGVGARAQARGRAVELLVTALAAVLGGAVAGGVAAAFAVVDPLGAGLADPATPLLGGVLAAGLVAVALLAAASVRRGAEHPERAS